MTASCKSYLLTQTTMANRPRRAPYEKELLPTLRYRAEIEGIHGHMVRV